MTVPAAEDSGAPVGSLSSRDSGPPEAEGSGFGRRELGERSGGQGFLAGLRKVNR